MLPLRYQNGKFLVLTVIAKQILCLLSKLSPRTFPQYWPEFVHNRNWNSFLASQEFQNQLIEDNDKIPSARIPINFEQFGKPLEELKRSETNDLVPEIVVNIIHNIKQLSKF